MSGVSGGALIRAVYFEHPARSESDLVAVGTAMAQLARLFRAAETLSRGDWTRAQIVGAHVLTSEVRVLSIEMSSPLLVTLLMTPGGLVASGSGLLLLAERICTFRVRVAREKKMEITMAAELDAPARERQAVRADALALYVLYGDAELGFGGVPHTRPTRIELLDPERPDHGDVEEIDTSVP
jgi:hypothetical protein